ncbi:Rossmann-like and DUF2520 domain-containing protein [Mucilaginibacter arboris]|uniref:DUF2520 domain-containing protein n=1 Tax=Mucilaginibacter arboris TaxID=2682090 RepID=A0A7K1SSR1_9SPHI|nr:F420-dependent NADP oxidoreductase [Mucilaginibacter arboris]MVN20349.1 DUF2520 domain-containing protein [Mucilaginibacter arboris]
MRITLIGSGNVATHLGAALKNAGHQIVQVWSRNLQNAALLAYHVKAEPIDRLDAIHADTDLIIISVKDDAVEDVASFINIKNVLVVHTSGAVSMQTLEKHFIDCGVFYPLQTFSKSQEIDFRSVPLCIESTDKNSTEILFELGRTISNQVTYIDSAQRKTLHLAAVFACNFPNYLYSIATKLLQEQQMDFSLIKPLILETALKVQEFLPEEVQTGPAIRGDEQTMAAHLSLLEQNPELQEIYRMLSQDIIKMAKSRSA